MSRKIPSTRSHTRHVDICLEAANSANQHASKFPLETESLGCFQNSCAESGRRTLLATLHKQHQRALDILEHPNLYIHHGAKLRESAVDAVSLSRVASTRIRASSKRIATPTKSNIYYITDPACREVSRTDFARSQQKNYTHPG